MAAALGDKGNALLQESSVESASLLKRSRALLGMFVAFVIWGGYVMFHSAGMRQGRFPVGAKRAAALHGEVSTRTRHVLSAMTNASPPIEAVILLGRVQHTPARIAGLWAQTVADGQFRDVPILLPMSPRAILFAFLDFPKLIIEGLGLTTYAKVSFALRDEVAMAFRMFSGTVAARWWAQNGTPCEVIFGITGTGDTTLLERAIRYSGGRTIHAVHGQATGPNFVGVSDIAVFRSEHDADAYKKIKCYKQCITQPAHEPVARFGNSGLLLLSNLAHPMNPNFSEGGLEDEIELLTLVANGARALRTRATPLLWKPHPAISRLSRGMQAELRREASAKGFEELPSDTRPEKIAERCLWVISTPSTVAIDLLQAGILPLIIDLQATVLDTAVKALPSAPSNAADLELALRNLAVPTIHAKRFRTSWEAIRPSRALDLKTPFG